MFKEILFYSDENGRPLGHCPRKLKASDVGATTISLHSTDLHGVPYLQVRRDVKNVDTDVWNDDGRPPTVLFQIAMPTIQFRGGHVEVFGFEIPNLVIAGLPRESYDSVKTPIARLIDEKPAADFCSMEGLRPQRILLVS